jgi:hypothetical protein
MKTARNNTGIIENEAGISIPQNGGPAFQRTFWYFKFWWHYAKHFAVVLHVAKMYSKTLKT